MLFGAGAVEVVCPKSVGCGTFLRIVFTVGYGVVSSPLEREKVPAVMLGYCSAMRTCAITTRAFEEASWFLV